MKTFKKFALILSFLIHGETLEASNSENFQDNLEQETPLRQFAYDIFDIDTQYLEQNGKNIRNKIQETLKSFDFSARPPEFSEKFFDFMVEIGSHVTYKNLFFQSSFADSLENGLGENVFSKVKILTLDAPHMETLSSEYFPALEKLSLINGDHLMTIIGKFSKLGSLHLTGCKKLISVKGDFPSLEYFKVETCPELVDVHFFSKKGSPLVQGILPASSRDLGFWGS